MLFSTRDYVSLACQALYLTVKVYQGLLPHEHETWGTRSVVCLHPLVVIGRGYLCNSTSGQSENRIELLHVALQFYTQLFRCSLCNNTEVGYAKY